MPPPISVSIPVAHGVSLEGFLYTPRAPLPSRHLPRAAARGAVLLHPHPRLGGCASNPVVAGLAAALAAAGVTAVAVNGRGVGGSGGSAPLLRIPPSAVTDAVAVVEWLSSRLAAASNIAIKRDRELLGVASEATEAGEVERVGVTRGSSGHVAPTVVLLGYSYGAGVALRVTRRDVPLVVISPPLGTITAWLLGVTLPSSRQVGAGDASAPALWVAGDADIFASESDLRAAAATVAAGMTTLLSVSAAGAPIASASAGGGVQLLVVPGAGHFWESGRVFESLRRAVVAWVSEL